MASVPSLATTRVPPHRVSRPVVARCPAAAATATARLSVRPPAAPLSGRTTRRITRPCRLTSTIKNTTTSSSNSSSSGGGGGDGGFIARLSPRASASHATSSASPSLATEADSDHVEHADQLEHAKQVDDSDQPEHHREPNCLLSPPPPFNCEPSQPSLTTAAPVSKAAVLAAAAAATTADPSAVPAAGEDPDGSESAKPEAADSLVAATARTATEEGKLGQSGEERDGWQLGGGLWEQAAGVVGFAGPALGLWLSHPIMSLIDTAVVGRGSSTELAALGPGTVACDHVGFLFMFLSVATSNLIATAMANQDPALASLHLSQLLFVATACGVAMTGLSILFTPAAIAAFAGSNSSIIPAACTYAKIRALAWPAVLATSVAQSACLGLRDVWSPLRCLGIASLINLMGDLMLCSVLGYGIAGAAWATMASQVVGVLLLLHSLASSPIVQLGISPPTMAALINFVGLAGPIFLTLAAKVAFYTLLTFQATSLGTVPLAAHQVIIGVFALCAVCAEPLSQTAQSFLPSLCVGAGRNLAKARSLLLTLVLMAVVLGAVEALVSVAVPVILAGVFTADAAVIAQMRLIVPPLAISLLLNPVVLAAEGALMATRDVSYLASSMLLCTGCGSAMLMTAQRHHLGLLGNWWILVAFQLMRLAACSLRLSSSRSPFNSKHRVRTAHADIAA